MKSLSPTIYIFKDVLLVDDSGFMRLVLADMLGADEQIHILGTAENGKEAFEKTKLLKPDVVLLDLTMKDYDGLYAVKHIMRDCPTPIVIRKCFREYRCRSRV